MFFTREDIEKIHQGLLRLGIKDSELPETINVNSDDTLTIVQDGKNKKINIEEFFNNISLIRKEDFINITDRFNKHSISLIEAIQTVPTHQRIDGLVITFEDINGDWRIYQFIGDVADFFNETKWVEYIKSKQLDIVRKELSDFKSITTDTLGLQSRTINIVKIQDKYISVNSIITDNPSYFITEPFLLKKGETITFMGAGDSTVAIVSEIIDNKYVPKISGKGHTAIEYSYTALKDENIVISSRNFIEYDSIIATLDKVNEIKIDLDKFDNILKNNLNYKEYDLKLNSELTNKAIYFNTASVKDLNKYNITEPFDLMKGQYLQITAKCDNNITLLAIKNADNSYTPIVCGKSNGKEDVTNFYAVRDYKNLVLCALEYKAKIVDFISNELLTSNINISKIGKERFREKLIRLDNLRAGNKILISVKSDDSDGYIRIGSLYQEFKKTIVTLYSVPSDITCIYLYIVCYKESTVTYEVQQVSKTTFKTEQSIYEDRLIELDKKTQPIINLPQDITYKNLIIESQESYNNLNTVISQEIANNNTNLNIIFKNGIYKFNNANVISLNNVTNNLVNLRFCCENAKIISDGKQYNREERISVQGSRNVFTTNSEFNYKNSIVINENYIYPDINGGKGIFYFTGNITNVDSTNHIYKVSIPNNLETSNIIGKVIVFTAWYTAIYATITDVKNEDNNIYLYFKTSNNVDSYVNADLKNYNVYSIAKILNFKDCDSNNSYYIDNNKIVLPDTDIAYECTYPQFISIINARIGSLILSNMNFIGSSNTGIPLINASGTSNIFILNSTFKNIGGTCLLNTLSNGNNGNILVKNCYFYKCCTPLHLNGNNCSIMNNVFKKTGYYWDSGCAMYIEGGNNFYIGHNIIEDYTYSALYIGGGGVNTNQSGSNGIIEYNLIKTVDWDNDYLEHQLIDSGAMQISIVNFPTIIRHNVIYNYKTRKSGRGIMMGGNCSQVSIYKNLITGITSYTSIDFYRGSEKNIYYPNGVENLLMYNVCEGMINMIGGDDFTEYPSYLKSNNDCICGYNLVGDRDYNMSTQYPSKDIKEIPYSEYPIVDLNFSCKNENHITISYDISSWKLSDFILNRLQLLYK